MRNRILYLSRSSIPYVKELMPIAKTIPGCLIMQQLDYWFEQKPAGFYKFTTPCSHPLYRDGDSWCEELGLSDDEFRTHFKKIGIRYKSKTEFEAAPDKFQGMFYCSYTDKRAQVTYWFRNHELLDKALDDLLMSKNHPDLPPKSGKNEHFPHPLPVTPGSRVTGTTDSQVTGTTASGVPVTPPSGATGSTRDGVREVGEVGLLEAQLVGSDITEKTNKDFQKPQPQERDGADNGGKDDVSPRGGRLLNEDSTLIFPASTLPAEREAVCRKLSECDERFHQEILDEIEGSIRLKSLKRGIVPFCNYLVEATKEGLFAPRVGINVKAQRDRQSEAQGNLLAQEAVVVARMAQSTVSQEVMDNLPPNIRQRLLESQAKAAGPSAEAPR